MDSNALYKDKKEKKKKKEREVQPWLNNSTKSMKRDSGRNKRKWKKTGPIVEKKHAKVPSWLVKT